MALTLDPALGSRDGWQWCPGCSAIREPIHIHGDPLENMAREELIRLIRVMRLSQHSCNSDMKAEESE